MGAMRYIVQRKPLSGLLEYGLRLEAASRITRIDRDPEVNVTRKRVADSRSTRAFSSNRNQAHGPSVETPGIVAPRSSNEKDAWPACPGQVSGRVCCGPCRYSKLCPSISSVKRVAAASRKSGVRLNRASG